MRIQPEAKAVEEGPKRRSQGDPAAEGGATMSAPLHRVPRGAEAA
jgi:hypothetical protein